MHCVSAKNPYNQVRRCGDGTDFAVGGFHRLPVDHEAQLQMELGDHPPIPVFL